MAGYLLRRALEMLATLIVASFLVFVVTEFSPGNVARKTLGAFALQEQVDLLYRTLHLNDPLLVRYVRWVGVLTGIEADPLQDPALGLHFTDPRGARYFGNFGYSTLYKAPGVLRATLPGENSVTTNTRKEATISVASISSARRRT